MRLLILLLFIGSIIASCGQHTDTVPTKQSDASEEFIEDGCVVKTSSNLVNQHVVGPIRNLVKDKEELGASGRCAVRFDITVNGKEYHLTEEEEGLEQLESLCYYARERARKDLLLDLGGEFKSEASLACKHRD